MVTPPSETKTVSTIRTPRSKNPLKLILNLALFTFFILLISYIGIEIADQYLGKGIYHSLAETIKNIGSRAFDFASPFIQLIIILIVLEWIIQKLGISVNKNLLQYEWNVQGLIGMVIVIAFALAALSGVAGAAMLKDVALVVVGFYFGTQKKIVDVVSGTTRTITTEEHTNERGSDKNPESDNR